MSKGSGRAARSRLQKGSCYAEGVWEGMPIRRPGFQSRLQHIPVMYPKVTLEVQEPQLSFCKIRTILCSEWLPCALSSRWRILVMWPHDHGQKWVGPWEKAVCLQAGQGSGGETAYQRQQWLPINQIPSGVWMQDGGHGRGHKAEKVTGRDRVWVTRRTTEEIRATIMVDQQPALGNSIFELLWILNNAAAGLAGRKESRIPYSLWIPISGDLNRCVCFSLKLSRLALPWTP